MVISVAVARYFRKYRSIANSLINVGAGIGDVISGPVIQHVIQTTSLKTCFQILSAVHLIPCLAALSFDPNIEVQEANEEMSSEQDKNAWRKFKRALLSWKIQFFGISFALAEGSNVAILTFLVSIGDRFIDRA